MDQQIASLAVWHGILLGYAILSGIEGPLLVALAVARRRPGLERLFAGAPLLICVWAFSAARVVWTSYLFWRGELAFLAGYPQPYPRSIAGDLGASLAQTEQLGWELSVATAVGLTLGWALFLRWFPRTRPESPGAAVDGGQPEAGTAGRVGARDAAR